MKTIKNLSPIIAILLFSFSALNAQSVVQLEPFDEIHAIGTVKVTLIKGTELKAEIEAKGIDYDDVNISVSEGTLKIRVLKSLIKQDENINIVVTYNRLRKIKAQAGADFLGNDILSGDQLSIRANQGSEIQLEVSVNKLEAVASEGGKINLKGKSEIVDVRTSSGGQFNALGLESDYTYATANTGGTAKVIAKELLEASANTGGVIEYKGQPTKTKMKELLSGKVKEI
jgi:hypothetical protein